MFGFPAALWTRYWTVSPELLEEAQLGAIPERLDDYYDMMRLWYEEYGGDHPAVLFDGNQTVQGAWREAIYLLTSQYIYAYASGEQPLTFNTPVFRAALEKVAAHQLHPGDNERVERQDYPLLAQGYTERIEGIKARMAALEDEKNLISLREGLAREEDAFAQEKKNRWEYPAEGIAEYRRLAPYINVGHSNLIWRISDALGVETILMKYLEGHATLDQALSELDRKVAMMFLESQ